MFKFETADKSAVTETGDSGRKDNNAYEPAETEARLDELESAISAIDYARKLLSQAIVDGDDGASERAGTEQRDGTASSRIFSDGQISGQRGKPQQR